MSKLYFKIGADYDKVIRLRDEIAKLKQELLSMNQAINPQAFARLEVQLRQTTQEFDRLVRQAAIAGAQLQNTTININHLNNGFGNLNSMLAKVGGAAALTKLASDIIRVRGEFQQLEIAFETMLGSKEKATTLMTQLTETAAKTPFDLQSISQGAKQLLAYGTASEEVNDTLVRLGNIASGLSIPLGDMVYLYGTTQTQGRLFTQDVRQFMGRGIPLVKELAAELGKTEQEVNEMVTAGKVGFPEVERVIRNMTSEGGQFYNLMESQSASLTGQISNLGDALDSMLNEIGTQTQGVASAGISAVSSLVENYETVGKILTGLIVTYGVYRAALITNIALTHSWAVAARVDAVAKGIQTIATKAQTIAQLALNSAMKANPYVLAATLVVGVASAMWALHDSTSAAERAQGKFNDELDKFKQKEEERKQKVGSLIRTIQDETETELEKVRAYEELQRLSPGLTDAYTREQLAVASLADTTKELNEIRDKTNYQNIISQLEKYTEYVNRLSKPGDVMKNVGDMYSGIVSEYGLNTTFKKRLELAKEDLKEWQAALDEYKRLKKEAEENAKPVEVKLLEAKNNREQILQEFLSAEMTLKEEQRKIKDSGCGEIPIWVEIRFENAQKALSNINGIIKGLLNGQSNVTYKEAYDTAKREWKVAQKALVESKKKSKAEYIAAKKDLDDKEKNFKDLGGDTNTTKQESTAEKLRKQQESIREQKDKNAQLEKKQSLDRQRQQQDLENQAAQAEIDALDDSFDKKDRQRKLNNKKEIEALERQKEDYINAMIQLEKEKFDAEEELKSKQIKGYVKNTFDSSTVKVDTSAFDGIIGNTSKKQLNDKVREQEDSWNEYIIKYGTFTQKKEAIDRKYKKLIEEAPDAGKAAALQKEWEESVANLDLSKLKQEINWEMIFGDLSKVTKDQLTKVKSQLQEFKKSSEFQKATPENIQVIEGAINSINNAMVDKGGFFGGMVDSVNELKQATEELQKAEEELAKANKSGTEAQKEEAQKKVNQAKNRQQNAETNVTKSSNKTVDHLTAVGNAIAQLGSSAEMSLSSFGNAAGSIVDAFTEAGSKIGGMVGAIFSILEGIQKQGLDGFVGNILESVAGAVGGILDTVTLGVFGIGGADYSKYNEMKEQYETISSIWDELIDKKTEYLEIGTTEERKRTEEEILDLIGRQEQTARNMGKERLNSGASTGSRSIGVRMKRGISDEGWSQWNNFADANRINRDLGGRMEGLFDLTSKQLEDLKSQAPDFWAKMDDDVRRYLNDIIECGEQTEETIEKAKELWAGISFDSLVDNFKSALSNMDSSAEDFADDFQQYLMNAIIGSFVSGDEFQKKLRGWYDKFAEYSKSEGKLDVDEKDELKKEWEQMVQEGIDFRDGVFSSMGFDSTSSSSQNSTQKGFEAMSQDTGNELNGRFTALQIAGEEIRAQNAIQSQSLNLLTMKSEDILRVNTEVRNIADETRTILANSYLELQEIRENTGAIVKPIQQMQKDMAEVKKNTSKL